MGTRLLRWLTPSWPLSLCVIAFWLLMTDSYSAAQFALALLLGWLIPRFAARLDREYARIGSLRPVPRMRTARVVAEIMSGRVRSARPGQSLADLVGAFSDGGLHHLPVADEDGRLVTTFSVTPSDWRAGRKARADMARYHRNRLENNHVG